MAVDSYNLAIELNNLSFELQNIAEKSINMAFASIKIGDRKKFTNQHQISIAAKDISKHANLQHPSLIILQKKEQSIISYRCSSCYPLSCAFACSSSAFNTFEWALTTSSSVNVRSGSS